VKKIKNLKKNITNSKLRFTCEDPKRNEEKIGAAIVEENAFSEIER